MMNDVHDGHRHDQQQQESLCMFEVPLMLKKGGMDRLLEMMGKTDSLNYFLYLNLYSILISAGACSHIHALF